MTLMKTLFAIPLLFLAFVAMGANPIPVGPEYNTLVDLLAHQPVANIVAKSYTLKGTNTIGDGGGGDFYWVAGSVEPTNTTSVFEWGTGRLFRQPANIVNNIHAGDIYTTNLYVTNITIEGSSYTTNTYVTNINSTIINTNVYQEFNSTTNLIQNSYLTITNSYVTNVNSVVITTNTYQEFNYVTNLTENSYLTVTNSYVTNISNVTINTNTYQEFSFTTNIIDNSVVIITNTYITINGTNVATVNPTIGYLPYLDNTNHFGDSWLYQSGTNIVDVGGFIAPDITANSGGTNEFGDTIFDWSVTLGGVARTNWPSGILDLTTGYVPYALNSTTLTNSPLYFIDNHRFGWTNTSPFLFYDEGNANLGMGRLTFSSPSTAASDTSIGYGAAWQLDTGGNNTSVGVYAGRSLRDGDNNVFIGSVAGNNNDGDDNTAIGYGALYGQLGSLNTATGASAGTGNSGDGTKNVFSGALAGYGVDHGTNNVFAGYSAGGVNGGSGTKNRSVIVGGDTGHWTTNLWDSVLVGSESQLNHDQGKTNIIGIGSQVTVTNNNEIVIGNTNNTKFIVPITTYTGTGVNVLYDDGTFKTAGSVSATNLVADLSEWYTTGDANFAPTGGFTTVDFGSPGSKPMQVSLPANGTYIINAVIGWTVNQVATSNWLLTVKLNCSEGGDIAGTTQQFGYNDAALANATGAIVEPNIPIRCKVMTTAAATVHVEAQFVSTGSLSTATINYQSSTMDYVKIADTYLNPMPSRQKDRYRLFEAKPALGGALVTRGSLDNCGKLQLCHQTRLETGPGRRTAQRRT